MRRVMQIMLILLVATLPLAGCSGGGDDLVSTGSFQGTTENSTGDSTDNSTGDSTDGSTGGSTVGAMGVLGPLQDIGDILGEGGDAWYDTEAQDINASGEIIGSSLDSPIFWDPATPSTMTIIPGQPGAYDDYYGQKETASENYFMTVGLVEINDAGLIIANAFTDQGESESRAFLWDSVNDAFVDLAPANYVDAHGKRVIGNFSSVADINNRGEVMLTAQAKEGTWAYYWDGVSYTTIDDLENAAGTPLDPIDVPTLSRLPAIQGATSSKAVALNEVGQGVVNSDGTAVFYDLNNGGRASLNSLSEAETTAVAINDSGHVVGNSGGEGFFWRGGVMYPISNPSGDAVEVVDINNNDLVAGNSGGEAFVWHLGDNGDGVFQSLGSLGGGSSVAVDINNSGMVVGTSTTGAVYSEGNVEEAVEHGFLYVEGTMYDLGSHVPPDYSYPFDPTFHFSNAHAINESGQVAGKSYSINVHARGFSLTPTFP